jgi:hypothetical protein
MKGLISWAILTAAAVVVSGHWNEPPSTTWETSLRPKNGCVVSLPMSLRTSGK